ncbi:diacylglycerol kinase [Roseovarius sp. CAU 1744]|uniref:diacylglycerol kinase n=1 Tax=Roseovarius sp. CAU 1744 TaxID=3140368 RepID=UPI00325BDD2E
MRGFADVWRGEEAFRLEFIAFCISIPAAFWLGSSIFSVALLIVSVLLVLIVEVLNSAIEAVVDRIGEERHEMSRMAKDLGSLAVLLATLVPAIVWLGAIYAKLTGQIF